MNRPGTKAWKKPIYGIGINDYDGDVVVDGKIIPSYHVWKSMFTRCYAKENSKAYNGCSVCDSWIYFTNFKKWFDENYIEGYCLDKDILVKGNKVYSPATCCFVPRAVNSLLTTRKNHRGEFPIGVTKVYNKYLARISMNAGNPIVLGSFDTPMEAFLAYKAKKEDYIKRVADEEYHNGHISHVVRDALYQYEVSIDD